ENTIGFTLQSPRDGDYGLRTSDGQAFLYHGDRLIMPCSEMKIVGKHNYANALAALAICDGLGIDEEVSKTVLRTFAGLEHRTQLVTEKDGVRWFNDSKGTNVGATIAAVEGMDGPVILIAGGQGKDQDFSPLLDAVKAKAKLVLLYGEDALLIEKALQDVDVRLVADLKEAVELAARSAQSGDNVLLSPACASFDMFKNYQERGDTFVKLVEAETNS
ncbi:MAG: UDP-N-acetylmuramoyl-L-alanine--D-glutamate ligase, partial [Gammaproteobacteria bacterium]|nr:UDP-N-acetylmuramoyl-L-alanine--D-glutamate ligase [Gammaproteobacteria bacterium]